MTPKIRVIVGLPSGLAHIRARDENHLEDILYAIYHRRESMMEVTDWNGQQIFIRPYDVSSVKVVR